MVVFWLLLPLTMALKMSLWYLTSDATYHGVACSLRWRQWPGRALPSRRKLRRGPPHRNCTHSSRRCQGASSRSRTSRSVAPLSSTQEAGKGTSTRSITGRGTKPLAHRLQYAPAKFLRQVHWHARGYEVTSLAPVAPQMAQSPPIVHGLGWQEG